MEDNNTKNISDTDVCTSCCGKGSYSMIAGDLGRKDKECGKCKGTGKKIEVVVELSLQEEYDKVMSIMARTGTDGDRGNRYEPLMIGDVLDRLSILKEDRLSKGERGWTHNIYGEGAIGNPIFDLTKKEEIVLSINLLWEYKRESLKPTEKRRPVIEYLLSIIPA